MYHDTVIGGLVFYKEYKFMTVFTISMFAVGVLVTILAVVSLSRRDMNVNKQDTEMDKFGEDDGDEELLLAGDEDDLDDDEFFLPEDGLDNVYITFVSLSRK